MKPALLVSVMLFLVVEAQGIRVLQQGYFTLVSHQKFHEENESSLIKESGGVDARVRKAASVLCKDGHCSSVTMERRFSRVTKEAHHSRPVFHEDYYGPRSHKPRHH